jgi:predicted Zn-ribbon and HTH transcriptional regulator
MASGHQATCLCGFDAEIVVGGSRADFRQNSPFPFYCKSCGLVSANTAARPPVCPKCKTTEILQYGKPPISVPKKGHVVLQNFNYEAFSEGNLCPSCQSQTLMFSGFLWMAS